MDEKIYVETHQAITLIHNGHKVASIEIEPGLGPYTNDFHLILTPIETRPRNMPGRYYTITKASHPNYFERK